MTDEECIATAMLHGAVFWEPWAGIDDPPSSPEYKWFVHLPGEPEPIKGGCAAATRGEAARKYCIRHKLLPEVN